MKPMALFGLVLLAVGAAAEPITAGTLIDEMVALRGLAEFPEPFYKTVQFSSYDHQSVLPGGKEWFYNMDGFGSEPIPNFEGVVREPDAEGIGEYLVCDVIGPGAVVREWTARIDGTIRMYLDDAETPVFDGSADDFFRYPYKPYVEQAEMDAALLDGTFYQRQAAYCPFPFAKRCRITWTGNLKRTHFYQLEVRCYDAGAEVVTFSPDDLKKYKKSIKRVAGIMANPDGEWPYASKDKPETFEVAVAPGDRVEALTIKGARAIERLTLCVEAADRDLALRQTILHVRCDQHAWGQVQSPVGDFFGAAPGVNPYISVPFTVAPDGTMTCRYVMPFAEEVEIVFENLGDQDVMVRGEAQTMPYAWDPDRSMHFRARWRINHGLTGSAVRVQDIPFLIANGAGVYVGSVTYVLNPNEVPSSGGNWWGEGDEKIFTDDDVRPSLFGTGSEDYYNYAWSSEEIFVFPYCGQPRNDGPANRGFVTNNRWHILDPLPFKYRMSFYMELFPHETNENMAYGRIGYHYGRPGIIDDHVVITREDVRRQELPPDWHPASRGGARNSVFFEPEERVQGSPKAVEEADNLWTGGQCYRWLPKAVGDELAFTFPVEEEGMYAVRLGVAHDSRSGRISFTIDGRKTGFGGEAGVADVYDPYRTLLRCIGTAALKLTPGEHTGVLRYEGGPEGVEAGIGLDFVWIQKQK